MAESGQVENNSEGGNQPQQNTTPQATGSSSQAAAAAVTAAPHSTSNEGPAVMEEGVIEDDYRGHPTLSEEPLSHPNSSSEPNSPPLDDSYSSGGEYHDEPGSMFMPHSTGGVVLLDQFVSPSATPPQMLLPMIGVQSKGLPSDHLVGHLGSNPGSPPPQGEELRKLLLKQLEYYFSKENLAADKYLLSQMDGDHYVPVQILASFNQVKKLTVDLDLILEVIRESTLLQLDDNDDKVRAVPEKRCVLILREIPQETPESAITGLFSGKSCPNCVTCKFADNDCWYVTFDSEEDTQKAYAFLREEVREFLGQPIRARIKGTQATRSSGMPKKTRGAPSYQNSMPSVYNGHPQMPFYHQPAAAAPGVVPPPPSSWPQQYYPDPNYIHYVNGFPQQQPQQGFTGPQQGHMPNNSYHSGVAEGRASRGRGNGRPPRSHSPTNTGVPNGSVGEIPSDRGRGNREHYGGRSYRRENEDTQRKIPRLNRKNREQAEREREKERAQPPPRQQTRSQQKLDLAPANFPPLPTADSGLASPTPTPPNHNHSEEGVSNLADIVKGKRYKEGNGFFPQNGLTANTGSEVSNSDGNSLNSVEQKDTTVVSQSSSGSTPLTTPVQTVTVTAASIVKQSPVVQPSPAIPPAGGAGAGGGQTTPAQTTTTQTVSPQPQQQQQQQQGPGSKVQAQPVAPKPQKTETKPSVKDTRQIASNSNVNNKGYVRYGDRENGSSKQNGSRNSQVTSKTDARSSQSASRNRHKDREKRPGSASRLPSSKPSPKSPKKPQSPQAPPPPPTPTTPTSPNSSSTATGTTAAPTTSTTAATAAAAAAVGQKGNSTSSNTVKQQECSKSEKLSYAQMIRRKTQPPPPPPPVQTQQPKAATNSSAANSTPTQQPASSGPQSKALPTSPAPTSGSAGISLTSTSDGPGGVLIGSSKSLPSSPVHKVAMEIGGSHFGETPCTSN